MKRINIIEQIQEVPVQNVIATIIIIFVIIYAIVSITMKIVKALDKIGK